MWCAPERRRYAAPGWCLLAVELDDELLLDRRVDDLPGREGVHEDAHPVRDDLDPGRDGTLPGLGAGDDERRELQRALAHLDDVVVAHPERRDVDLLAVDGDVAVAHQLAGHVAGLREARAVDHVVETALEDAQEVLAGLALAAVGLVVVAPELLLQDAVDAGALLLLAHLQQVLAVLGATATVLARGVGADLDRALRGLALAALEEQLHLLATAAAAVGTRVAGHLQILLVLRLDATATWRRTTIARGIKRVAALAAGSRCGGRG